MKKYVRTHPHTLLNKNFINYEHVFVAVVRYRHDKNVFWIPARRLLARCWSAAGGSAERTHTLLSLSLANARNELVALFEGIRFNAHRHGDIHQAQSTGQRAINLGFGCGDDGTDGSAHQHSGKTFRWRQVVTVNAQLGATGCGTSARKDSIHLHFWRCFFFWDIGPNLVDRILHLHQAAIRSLCYTKPFFTHKSQWWIRLRNHTKAIRLKNHTEHFLGVLGINQVVAELSPVVDKMRKLYMLEKGSTKFQCGTQKTTGASHRSTTYPKWSD